VVKPETGHTIDVVGNPFKSADQKPLGYPPGQGADTRAVLAEVCRYADETIEKLIASKAVYVGKQTTEKKEAAKQGAAPREE